MFGVVGVRAGASAGNMRQVKPLVCAQLMCICGVTLGSTWADVAFLLGLTLLERVVGLWRGIAGSFNL